MSFEGAFLKLRLRGWVEPGDMRNINSAVVELAGAHGCTRLLIDAVELVGRQNLAEVFDEVRRLPTWVHNVRTAIVDSVDNPEYDEVYERAASARGLQIRYFRSESAALEWLAEPRAR